MPLLLVSPTVYKHLVDRGHRSVTLLEERGLTWLSLSLSPYGMEVFIFQCMAYFCYKMPLLEHY
jgi:hypothetical protein